MSSGTNWANIIPAVPIGSRGHTLGYYSNVAQYIVIVPLVLLGLGAIVYNVAVGLATKWMYRYAWKAPTGRGRNIIPKYSTLVWEEIYTVNIKVANYLLGNAVVLKEDGNHLVLQIHDYVVYMPLAMVVIQVSQVAVVMVLTILFFDFLVLQVSHVCNPYHSGLDCFESGETNLSATPLPCKDVDQLNVTNITCFQLSLNPVIAASIAGGFLKMVPHVFFSTLTYHYMKFLKVTKYFKCSKKCNTVCHVLCGVCAVAVLLLGGVIVLVIILEVPAIHDITFTANPIRQLTIAFCFIGYFLIAGTVWSIVPLEKIPNRFSNVIYRQSRNRQNQFEDTGIAIKGSSEKLHPWVVVDQSMSTNEYTLMSDDKK